MAQNSLQPQKNRDNMGTTKPGERKLQILQTLAGMLEQPKGEKITTAALASKLDVSEAALYRHFASKAQMFEGLIEFIESSVFGLINQITEQQENGLAQVQAMTRMLLDFAERNPGMTRVMNGDALVNEDDRLQLRMNQFVERIELALKQALRTAVTQGQASEAEVALRANMITSLVVGRWHRFAKTGFKQKPSEGAQAQISLLLL
jgi:TetR/AcrR family transcriptional regulator